MQEQKSSGVIQKLEATILGMRQTMLDLETTTARIESDAADTAGR